MNGHDSAVDYVELAAEIVSAYISNNSVPPGEVAPLIGRVHAALTGLGTVQPEAKAPSEPQVPAVPVRKSITPDYIVCLEDGRSFKSLKRHLRAKYDMSPEQYRAKWGLPSDYPMVAPNYAKARSDLAKAIGLGQVRGYDAAA